MKLLYCFLTLCTVLSCSTCNEEQAQSSGSIQKGIRVVKTGLNHPWEITWSKDDHIWMTERDGKISRIDPTNGATSFSYTIGDVEPRGEGGLLGMALHPDFLKNGWLYVVYNYRGGGYHEKLVRFTYSNNTLTDAKILLDGIDAAGIHNGSRIWITDEAQPKLFISTGDASVQSNAQKTNSLNGKILRLNPDGSIPTDNPFPGNPVWSYGHRNPQGLVMVGNTLYASEHGPSEEDELNIIEKGRNFGWPELSGPCREENRSFCTNNRVKDPIWSSGSSTIAVCGLDYYNGNSIPEWKNSLLMVTLKNSSLRQLKLSSNGQTITDTKTFFAGKWGRLRDVCISPSGKVYLCSSNGGNDVLIEISSLP